MRRVGLETGGTQSRQLEARSDCRFDPLAQACPTGVVGVTDVEERRLRRVEILGLSMLTGRQVEIAAWLVERAKGSHTSCTIVSHINVNNYYWLHRHPELQEKLRSECVLILDGIGVQLGAFFLGRGWLQNLNGTDLFPLVMREAARAGLRVFLLGGRTDVVERSAEVVRQRFPGVEIAGCRSGYFEPGEEASIASAVRRCNPDLLLVGCGFLRQELFALRQRNRLQVPLIWNVGGLFDFVSGAKPRAPAFVRRARLEWAFRFLVDPRTMWHRNFVAAPWFLGHVLHQVGRGGSTLSPRQHVGPLEIESAERPEMRRDPEPRATEESRRVRRPRRATLVGGAITGEGGDA